MQLMMVFSLRVGRVTLKIQRIDKSKYVYRCGLLGMTNREIVITFCCVYLQVRYSKIAHDGTHIV